jgi:lipopolysaccharide biosynthesis glycosyltransferase
MSEEVRIFVGTDGRAMKRAELALEHSIRKHASTPITIEWMDEERGDVKWTGWSREKWYTRFTCFRAAIPEFSNFEGRSIYVDVDQIFLRDPKELLELPIPEGKAFLSLNCSRTDVMVFDNKKFKTSWWPNVSAMKASDWGIGKYLRWLKPHWAPLPPHWCCNDGGMNTRQTNETEYKEGETALIHYTEMNWQPWRPYPKGWKGNSFTYPPHPHPEVSRIWWEMYALALEDKYNLSPVLKEYSD